MFSKINHYIVPPVFQGDEAMTRRAALLNETFFVSALFTVLVILSTLIGNNVPTSSLIIAILWLIILTLFWSMARRGRTNLAAFGLPIALFIAITLSSISLGTIRTPTAGFYIFWGMLVGMLFHVPGLLIATSASSLAVLGLIAAENAGLLPQPNYSVGVTQWLNYTILFSITASLTFFGNRITRNALSKAVIEIERRKLTETDLKKVILQLEQVQVSLQMSEARHRLLAEHAGSVIWTMSVGGDLTYISPTVLALRGLTPEEAMCEPIHKILTPRSIQVFREYFTHIDEALKTGGTLPEFRGELEYYRKNGSTVWTEVLAFPVQSDDGSIVEILGFSRDISNSKQYIDQLLQARLAAEVATRSLSETNVELSRVAEIAQERADHERVAREDQEKLLTMLAHELKTPLATIGMLTSAMRRGREEVNRAIGDMRDVINRCVQVGYLTERRLIPRHEVCDMANLVADAITSSQHSKGFDLSGCEAPVVLNGDSQMLSMIIDNMIDNACKYSPSESRVRITLTQTRHDECQGVELSVANLPGDAGWPDPARLYEKYYRSPHAQRQTGSGLGLFLASGLAKMMGGRIDYRPQDDHIHFVLWMPNS
jgi:PAS domain S-box-containing protein